MRRVAMVLFALVLTGGVARGAAAQDDPNCDPMFGGPPTCIPGPDTDYDGDGDIDADDQAWLDAQVSGDCDYFNSLPDTECDEPAPDEGGAPAPAPAPAATTAGPVEATPAVTG